MQTGSSSLPAPIEVELASDEGIQPGSGVEAPEVLGPGRREPPRLVDRSGRLRARAERLNRCGAEPGFREELEPRWSVVAQRGPEHE